MWYVGNGKRIYRKDYCYEKRALSISEAAEMLGVSRPTLYKMIKEGKIPALRLRRRIVIPIDEFNEWVRIESWGAIKATI